MKGVYSRGEVVDGHDTTGALLRGEVVELREPGSLVLQADKLEAGAIFGFSCRAANGHPEALSIVSIMHRRR